VEGSQLPLPAEQLPTGTILIKQVESPSPGVGLMPEFPRGIKETDVDAQLGRLLVYARIFGCFAEAGEKTPAAWSYQPECAT